MDRDTRHAGEGLPFGDLRSGPWVNPGKAGDVGTFRDYLLFLRAGIAKAQAKGDNSDAVLKAMLPQVKAKYGDWAFPEFAAPGIQRTDEELRGVKRLPPVTR